METILVTGATGFCGRHLVRFLLQSKKYRICGTYFHYPVKMEGVHLYSLNLRNRRQTETLVDQIRPSAIVHLAAQSIASKSWTAEEETVTLNVQGTLHLLEAVRRYQPKAKFLFASSNLVYGKTFQNGFPVTESSLLWPESPYAVSKAMAEMACLNYASQFGLHTLIARAFNHTGRGQSPDFVFSNWCRQIALTEKENRPGVLKVGDLSLERDFLHVDDVVRAYECLLDSGKAGEIYNVCTGSTHSLREYADKLLRESRVDMEIEVEKKRLRGYDHYPVSGSPEKLNKLGWCPQTTAFQALHELLNEWRKKVTPSE